jgi:hypothetical protein
MAGRIATEYVNAVLTLPEADMPKLIALCNAQQLRLQVVVMDNGNQELLLEEAAGGESLRLTFERVGARYRCSLSCRVVQPKLTNTLRKLVSSFKGDAIVNRIYQGFTMVYHYRQGSVVRIAECKGGVSRTVYEYRDTAGLLEAQFKRRSIEEEIAGIWQAVNELLDLRNRVQDEARLREIDERLRHHSRLLFYLEA